MFIFYSKEETEGTEEADMLFPELESEASTLSNETEEAIETSLLIDIKGAVKRPGVYEMDHTERVQDVVDRAGGFTKNADQTMINLAQKLMDEMVIYVPIDGEEILNEMQTSASLPSASPIASDASGEGKVHLNQATQEEIETLNGIGPKKAEAILTYREEHGPFQSVEQLTEVSGIGDKTVENIRDQIVVP